MPLMCAGEFGGLGFQKASKSDRRFSPKLGSGFNYSNYSAWFWSPLDLDAWSIAISGGAALSASSKGG